MAIKLIAYDLDGTLLDDEKRLPEENIAALSAAADRGIYIVASTGRLYDGIPELIRQLPFTRYCIVSNGASVYDAAERRTVLRDEIPMERALEVCEYMDALPVIYYSYHADAGRISRRHFEVVEQYIPAVLLPDFYRVCTSVEDLHEDIRRHGGGVQKLQMHFRDRALRLREFDEFPKHFPELMITTSLPTNIEINSTDANKGHALLGLCGLLGIDPAETMAFGDGSNDISMLHEAGIGVAMANADAEVKAVADVITDSNNAAGVAKMIRKIVL